MGIPVVCNAHRLNSATIWSLGVGGTDKTCKNPDVERLMKRLAALVRVSSHGAVNNYALKDIQKELDDLSKVYELVRRNDIRLLSTFVSQLVIAILIFLVAG